MTSILTTGGAGFISSHTCLVLLEAGHRLLVLDNFSNSSAESLRRVAELAGPGAGERLVVVEGDIRSAADLERAFAAANQVGSAIEAVINFAGLKTVGELLQYPLRYWDISLGGSLQLLAAMQSNGSCILVFSSRAISYGIPEKVPIPETVPIQPINPCGHSKAAVEQLLADLAARRLGLRTRRGLAEMCRDGWCCQQANLSGDSTATIQGGVS